MPSKALEGRRQNPGAHLAEAEGLMWHSQALQLCLERLIVKLNTWGKQAAGGGISMSQLARAGMAAVELECAGRPPGWF